ncbi:hypothetical protein T4C_2562 [Trichinella pseudospiralis]|uniref:Uncharacterized protein n=1 Tax=Trichinella pseudospiralis TaxID=6337 RepID=A0A0V1JRD0_TRIPS|nr:hypothetical protein T4C_2562 [Trichinella pseudospiralis]
MYNLYRPPSQGVFGGPGTQHSHLPNSSVPSGAATGFAMKPDKLPPSVIFAESLSLSTNYGIEVTSKFLQKINFDVDLFAVCEKCSNDKQEKIFLYVCCFGWWNLKFTERNENKIVNQNGCRLLESKPTSGRW